MENGKHQIQVENSSKKKMNRLKQSKTILIDENNVKLYLFLGRRKHW